MRIFRKTGLGKGGFPTLVAACLMAATQTADANGDRSVALVLDASGSMNGRLGDGTPKIDAAKSAVRDVVGQLPAAIRLSFRAYGHQSPRARKDCDDTERLVDFGSREHVAAAVMAAADGVTAQGYTPITRVLKLAAEDVGGETGASERLVVLVSDGKETCSGDPCAAARALAAADAKLVIHTIGFGVDAQAKQQLQCIADVARGRYFDANSLGELSQSMTLASTSQIETENLTLTLDQPKTGTLELIGPYFNEVVDAETGDEVAKLTDSNPSKDLPPGIYNINFGGNLWLKSVQVTAGETTTITPGRLRVNGPYFHDVLDPETGEAYAKITTSNPEYPFPAGRYDVQFGDGVWKNIEVRAGETTVLEPGRIHMQGAYFNAIRDAETGAQVAKLTDSNPEFPVPPGRYTVSFGDGAWTDIDVAAGETKVLKPARIHIVGAYFNAVRDAETGAQIAKITDSNPEFPVPPGRYVVDFGDTQWTDITVGEGERLVLNPGRIKIIKSDSFFYDVFDAGGKRVAKLSSGTNDFPLPPGAYTIDIEGRKVPVTLSEGKRFQLTIN